MIRAMNGGRAFGRVLSTLLLAGLCLSGLALMARGAVIPAKAWAAQILLERAFDASMAKRKSVRPWPWADTAPVARVSVPRLRVSQIVLSGGSGQAMAFGPTLMPTRGAVTVMAAHRDTHFAFLQSTRIGDRVEVEGIDGRRTAYRIAGAKVVRWDRFAYPADPARALLALTTCYPFGATAHGPLRYVVWAERIGGGAVDSRRISRWSR